jgi:hypothetical protein
MPHPLQFNPGMAIKKNAQKHYSSLIKHKKILC